MQERGLHKNLDPVTGSFNPEEINPEILGHNLQGWRGLKPALRVPIAIALMTAACGSYTLPSQTDIDASENQSKTSEVLPGPGVEVTQAEAEPTQTAIATPTRPDFSQGAGGAYTQEQIDAIYDGAFSRREEMLDNWVKNYWGLAENRPFHPESTDLHYNYLFDANNPEDAIVVLQALGEDYQGALFTVPIQNGEFLQTPPEVPEGEFTIPEGLGPLEVSGGEEFVLANVDGELVRVNAAGEVVQVINEVGQWEEEEKEIPVEVQEIADKLGENFRVELKEDKWVVVEDLTLQVTESQTEERNVDVIKYSLDGTSFSIQVHGEEKTFSESEEYRILNPEELLGNGKYFFEAGLQSADGKISHYYNPWGEWVANEERATKDGLIKYNPSELFAGEFVINEEVINVKGREIPASTLFYEEFVKSWYNLQVIFDNKQVLDKYPDRESFMQAAREGEYFDLLLPVEYPASVNPLFRKINATVVEFENVRLDKTGFDISEESREHILDYPTEKDPHIKYEWNYESYNATASVKITKDSVDHLWLHFKRGRFFSDLKADPLLIDVDSEEERLFSARQMIEAWFFATSATINPEDVYDKYIPGMSDLPILGLHVTKGYNRYSLWENSPFLNLRE